MPTGHPRPWSEAQDQQLIEAYRAGETLEAIAGMLGCEIFHVWDRLTALRAAGHHLPRRRTAWTDDRRELLAKRRREGRSLRELEAEFDLTRGSITSQLRTLRRLGYDLGDPRT